MVTFKIFKCIINFKKHSFCGSDSLSLERGVTKRTFL